jgi:lysophospholipase L1-like esterase
MTAGLRKFVYKTRSIVVARLLQIQFYPIMRILFFLLVAFFAFSCAEPEFPAPNEDNVGNTVSPRYLALGDSYTIGESVSEPDRWPNQLASLLEEADVTIEETSIIAQTGWTTGNLINAIDNADLEPEYDLVSLLIGVNNQFQGRTIEEYQTQFEELLQTSIALAKGNKDRVFVVSIPDYGYTPFGQGNQAAISEAIDEFNAVHREITENYGVAWYDITPISRRGLDQPDLVANDGLHPSGVQYREWVESFVDAVKGQL